jgi:hypothetical protein
MVTSLEEAGVRVDGIQVWEAYRDVCSREKSALMSNNRVMFLQNNRTNQP